MANVPESKARDLAAMRAEYMRGELHRSQLKADPIEQFSLWFAEARSGGILEPNAMSLATVSADGQPSVRTVLLKSFDVNGFVFFTNLESRKSREIGSDAKVSLLFPWIAQERQVTIAGNASQVSREEAEQYFKSRPRNSQIGAWASRQSSVVASREVLEKEFMQIRGKFDGKDIPLPPFWGGFRVRPQTIEFWQGRESRLHDRLVYTRQSGNTWKIDRLSP